MKPSSTKLAVILVLSLTAFAPQLFAQLTIPYADGSDGALNITSDTVIDLSQAVTGLWTNTSGSPGKGIYDASQWAIIFKYSSVNIASNMTVTFVNHYSHAPVVWLVNGSVTINGTLSLDGQPGIVASEADVVEPGPGGFRGGAYSSTFGSGSGFGPGGGQSGNSTGVYIDYPYGTTNIVPLIGGSGSGGYSGSSGSGGGGAILIAAANLITVNGNLHANGSINYNNGSGGALRLVANQILGNGQLAATSPQNVKGRIRVEANTVANTLVINPAVIGVVPANPPIIFPATNAPTVTVVSVGGVAAPADPKAIMSPSPGVDDISIATITNQVTIQVQTKNFPTNGTVTVYVKPRNSPQSLIAAAFVSGNSNQATWQALAYLPYPPSYQGHTVIQARAVLP